MGLEINPATGECNCISCHEARYDIALGDVRDAKVALADAFIEADELLDAALASGGFDANTWPGYLAALAKRNEAVEEVRRLQAEANRALDRLIARKREEGGNNG